MSVDVIHIYTIIKNKFINMDNIRRYPVSNEKKPFFTIKTIFSI